MNGFLIVFDLTESKQSLAGVKNWTDQIKWLGPQNANVILVGNKSDLPRKISKEDAERTARENNNCPYLETSAQSGTNVCAAFNYLLLKAMGQKDEADKVLTIVINPQPAPKKSSGWCF